MISITPVLNVEKIEPSLVFWEKGLGFERAAQVPEEGDLVFVQLVKDGNDVMYQTIASLEADLPAIAEAAKESPSFLYVKVGDLDDVILSLKDFEVVVKRRRTFYGADEIGYKEPGGHYVVFAQFKDDQ